MLVHLRDYPPREESYALPQEMTQYGMSDTLDIPRGCVQQALMAEPSKVEAAGEPNGR